MGKKMFVLIVVLMSVSLMGIIAVQLYWINNAVESKNEQFTNDVQKSLNRVVERINEKEESQVYNEIQDLINAKASADNAQIKNFLIQQIDTTNNRKITFGTTVLEENFEIPLDFLDNESIIYTRVSSKKDFSQTTLIRGVDDIFKPIDEKRYSFSSRLKKINENLFSDVMANYKKYYPINQRVNNNELNETIKDELQKRNINLDFKYGVYGNDGLATKLKSGYYTINTKNSYKYPLFKNDEDVPEYILYVTFPTKNKHILSGISGILLLSFY
jgi:two-component system phosphate regulon sensor histidine kinase PhoR